MRIRTVKPEFWRSDDTASLNDWNDRLIFIGLWSYVDDNGVGRDNAPLIMADLFPQEPDPVQTLARIRRALDELSRRHLIVRYEVENRAFFYVTGWHHQKIDRPSAERYPKPPTCADGSIDEGSLRAREDSRGLDAVSGIRDQVSEDQGAGSDTGDKSPAPRAQRATRIPTDFEATDSMRLWAAEKVPGLDIARSTEKFRNHFAAKAGRGSTMLDWTATWRNWLLSDYERMPAHALTKPSTTDARVNQADAAVRSLQARGIDTGSRRHIEAS